MPDSINYDGLMTSELRHGDNSQLSASLGDAALSLHHTVPSVNLYADHSIGKNQSLIVDLAGQHTGHRAEPDSRSSSAAGR